MVVLQHLKLICDAQKVALLPRNTLGCPDMKVRIQGNKYHGGRHLAQPLPTLGSFVLLIRRNLVVSYSFLTAYSKNSHLVNYLQNMNGNDGF